MLGGPWGLLAIAATSTTSSDLTNLLERILGRDEPSSALGVKAPVVPSRITRQLALRLSLGPEWDTNAPRTVDFEGSEPENREDALMRLLLDTQGVIHLGGQDQLQIGYLLGAKRFFSMPDEDQLAQRLTVSSYHSLRPSTAISAAFSCTQRVAA